MKLGKIKKILNYKKNKPDDWATAESVHHRNLHRYNYEIWIRENFAIANSRKAVEARLKQVKARIKVESSSLQGPVFGKGVNNIF